MSSAAMHIARTGLDAQDMRMRVISNNLANVNTTGLKKDRASFATLSYQTVTAAGAASASESKYATGRNLGTGVRIQGTARMDTQGSMQTTGNSLDMALDGDGYFQVQLPGGGDRLVRQGRERCAVLLEPRRVDVGEIVRDHPHPHVLGVEPGAGDMHRGAAHLISLLNSACASGMRRLRPCPWRTSSDWPALRRRVGLRACRPAPASC